MNKHWTKEELEAAKATLSRHSSFEAAFAEISSSVRHVSTPRRLWDVFKRAGLKTPSSFLKKAAPPAADGLTRILVIPDTHAPFHSEKAWQVALAAAGELKPHVIVVIGDFVDCYSISRYPKSAARKTSLKAELDVARPMLRELAKLAPRHIYCEGNHEWRLERFVNERAPELFGLIGIREFLLDPTDCWSWVPYQSWTSIGKMSFSHDVGRSGVNAGRQTLQEFGGNICFGHCLPLTYDVATPNGWVNLATLSIGDIVYAYQDGAIVETVVQETVQYSYTGEMACFSNASCTQHMTDRHHIFTKDGRYIPIREALACGVRRSDLVHAALPLTTGREYPISDALLRLVVAYCADGSLDRGKYVRFHISKHRKILRLSTILAELNVIAAWGPPGKNGGRKLNALPRSLSALLSELAPGKQLPTWLLELSSRQRQLVIDELGEWDGSKLHYNCAQFASSKMPECNLVQLLLLQNGQTSRLLKRTKKCNIVTYSSNRTAAGDTPLRDLVQWRSVVGLPVGCITTDQQNFIVRTDAGRVEVSGNTHRGGVVYESTLKGEHRVALNVGWLGDPLQIDYAHRASALRNSQHGFGWIVQDGEGLSWAQFVPIIEERCCVVDGRRIVL